MIVLLAASHVDALAWRERTGTPEADVHLIVAGADPRLDRIEAGARVVRTGKWVYDQRTVGALASLHTRIGLVDPTGLLGPVDRREGARTTAPAETPVVGAAQAAARRIRHTGPTVREPKWRGR